VDELQDLDKFINQIQETKLVSKLVYLFQCVVSLGPIKKENISKNQKSSKKSSKAYSPPLFYAIFPHFFFFI
jgi:hypothetical protein